MPHGLGAGSRRRRGADRISSARLRRLRNANIYGSHQHVFHLLHLYLLDLYLLDLYRLETELLYRETECFLSYERLALNPVERTF